MVPMMSKPQKVESKDEVTDTPKDAMDVEAVEGRVRSRTPPPSLGLLHVVEHYHEVRRLRGPVAMVARA